ncbi:hypothetical protein AB0K34_04980 [Actinomadura sp. NPDC049382]|uniref:hypothetical protein n=1 Tax=Actinomadura sp. NPDC049382 TaxID=3158220 RepID=UPI00341F2F44
MSPAPAHGDGPTGPSTPTGRTEPAADTSGGSACGRSKGFRDDLKWARSELAKADAENRAAGERAEQAKRERDTAREALNAAAIVIASLRDQRDQARDAIAAERRRRLAAEAAVRRGREVARNRIAVPADVLLDALTIEQPKETP